MINSAIKNHQIRQKKNQLHVLCKKKKISKDKGTQKPDNDNEE